MFKDSGRKLYGIPSGLTKPGDILMYGNGKHIVLNTSEQLAYTESVMEFERGKNRGLISLKELEARYGDDLLICAPLPEPGELGEIYD